MRIHVATVDEAQVLAELHWRSAEAAYGVIFPPEAPQPSLDRLRSLWMSWLEPGEAAGLTGFIAEDAGEPVGVVLAGPDSLDASVGHLARMYVVPDRWGHGIGRALYLAATGHLRATGHRKGSLWVLEANLRARSWYERMGWMPTGERKTAYAPASIDELRYWKVLSD